MQGFLSRDGLPPADLLAIGREEVRGYGGEIVDGNVAGRRPARRLGLPAPAQPTEPTWRARRLLVATGLRDVLPDVPGVRERFGRDVLHCPYCHGYEVRDQPDRRAGRDRRKPSSTPSSSGSGPPTSSSSRTPTTLTADQREQLTARAIGVVDGPVSRLVVDGRPAERRASSRTAASSLAPPCSSVPGSSRQRPARGAGRRHGRPRLGGDRRGRPHHRPRGLGGRQRWPTRGPRSSPPPARARPPPSRVNADLVEDDVARPSAVRRGRRRADLTPARSVPARPIRPHDRDPHEQLRPASDPHARPAAVEAPARAHDLAGRLPHPRRPQRRAQPPAATDSPSSCGPSCSPPSPCRSSSTASCRSCTGSAPGWWPDGRDPPGPSPGSTWQTHHRTTPCRRSPREHRCPMTQPRR